MASCGSWHEVADDGLRPDPAPPARTTEGAVAAIPQIQFFSTVPLARLAAESDAQETGDGDYETTDTSDDGWEEETWP